MYTNVYMVCIYLIFRAKCTVIIRIINFITVLLGKHHKEAMKVSLFSNPLYYITLYLCYCYSITHINYIDLTCHILSRVFNPFITVAVKIH